MPKQPSQLEIMMKLQTIICAYQNSEDEKLTALTTYSTSRAFDQRVDALHFSQCLGQKYNATFFTKIEFSQNSFVVTPLKSCANNLFVKKYDQIVPFIVACHSNNFIALSKEGHFYQLDIGSQDGVLAVNRPVDSDEMV